MDKSTLKKQFKTYLEQFVKEYNEKKDAHEQITYNKALHMLQRRAKEYATFLTKDGRPYHYSALEYFEHVIFKSGKIPKVKVPPLKSGVKPK